MNITKATLPDSPLSRKDPPLLFRSNSLETLVSMLIAQTRETQGKQVVISVSNEMHAFIKERFLEEVGSYFGITFLLEGAALGLPSLAELSLFLMPMLPSLPFCQELPLLPLSEELAAFFLQGFLHKENFLTEEEGWLKDLFSSIAPLFARARLPKNLYAIHLFALQKPSFPLLQLLNASSDPLVCWYSALPSPHYLGDLISDKARSYFFQNDACDAFARDRNPFLANFGKTALQLFRFLNNASFTSLDLFQKPSETSLLSQLQADLFDLSMEKRNIVDASLVFHKAASPYFELQSLLEEVKQGFSSGDLVPSDIKIYAPAIEAYLPAIELLFAKESAFSFSVHGVSHLLHQESAAMLSHFFALLDSRFSYQEIKTLFLYPSFQKRHAMTEEDVHRFFLFLERFRVSWGYDIAMRKRCGFDLTGGTWKEAETFFAELLLSRSEIDFGAAETLANAFHILQQLSEASLLVETPKTLPDWIKAVGTLLHLHFCPDSEIASFCDRLQRLHAYERPELFAYAEMKRIFFAFLEKKSRFAKRSDLPQIAFFPLREGSITPAKWIFVLGLGEEFPPQKESFLRTHSLPDSRYLLLEALLLAKERCILSCLETPSPLLEELLFLVKRFYDPSKTWVEKPLPVYQDRLPVPPPLVSIAPSSQQQISLKNLFLCASNPIKLFAQETLKLHLTPKQSREEEEFQLSPLVRFQLKDAFLHGKDLFQSFHQEGKLPLFLALTQLHWEEEKRQLFPQKRLTYILDASCKKPVALSETKWLLPALWIGKTCLTGTLSDISEAGILTQGNAEDRYKALPRLLIASAISTFIEKEIPSKLISLTEGKEEEITIRNPHALSDYLTYMKAALAAPSPLAARQAAHFLKTGETKEPPPFDPYQNLIAPDMRLDWKSYFEVLV